MDSENNFVIAAIPPDHDRIWDVSSEDPPHVTLLYLPSSAILEAKEAISAVGPEIDVDVQVKNVDVLGDEGAQVAFIDPGDLTAVREALLEVPAIKQAHDSIEQYEQWTAHLTLGYPDSPPLSGDVPDTINLDRLVVLADGLDEGYDMEPETPIEEIEQTDEVNDAYTDGPIPFHGVAVTEGVRTGDMRKFAKGALTWTDGMDLAWCKVDMAGHDGAVVVGRIHQMWREGDELRYSGEFTAGSAEAEELIGYLAQGSYRGVSVDVDDSFEAIFETLAGEPVEPDSEDQPVVTTFTNGRVRGLTVVRIQAFVEAWISLGNWPDEDEQVEQPPLSEEDQALVAALDQAADQGDNFAEIDEGSWDGDASNYTPEQWYSATLIHLSDDKENKSDHKLPIYTPDGKLSRAGVHAAAARINQTDAPDEQISKAKASLRSAYKQLDEEPPEVLTAGGQFISIAPGKTEDGPGWLTHPVDTDRLRDYWVRGPGAAKIGWGLPGDFNRCRVNLAKYIKPQHLAGYCANRHYDALGFWPGQHHRAGTETGAPVNIVASAGRPDVLPASWFDDPNLGGPSPIVVTEDGRVYGHLATWGTCHIGIPGSCVTPPTSKSQYAYFRTGAVCTDSGDVAVGQITMGTGHASLREKASAALAHYDNTGTVVADVAAGEDEYGIWVAGATRRGVTAEQVEALRGSALSGDWRTIRGSMELVAALAVNTPGFPIPRAALAASAGQQESLVAAGIVPPQIELKQTVEELVSKALETSLARRDLALIKAAVEQQHLERIQGELRKMRADFYRPELEAIKARMS